MVEKDPVPEKQPEFTAPESVYPYQMTAESLVRIATTDGHFYIVKKLTPERVSIEHNGYKYSGEHGRGNDLIVRAFRDGREEGLKRMVLSGQNPEEDYVVITDTSFHPAKGFFGFPVDGMKKGEVLFFSVRSPFPFYTSRIENIVAQTLLPDTLTAEMDQILLQLYRREFGKLVETAIDDIKSQIAQSPKIELLHEEAEQEKPQDRRKQVAALIMAFFKSIEATGTLPLDAEQFERIRETLTKFVLYHCYPGEESSMIKLLKREFALPRAGGGFAFYRMTANFRIYDGRIVRLWIDGPASGPEALKKK